MTVEEIRGDFPAGMRVLAVDDDAICLKLLDTLLRKCQYNVTTTNQAMIALNMIRENKDRFDLVICDVHMPDVDGFKLLELIGLEMDLPVIMLSANSDPELVMKGVSHGACDYLVKPVRLEELRNIWQHVIRRKKFDSKNQNRHGDQVKTHQARGEGDVSPLAGNSNQNGKSNRKRKDDEDEHEDTGNNHEDPGTQKKPRVVWTPELHKEFVAAVHQLGIQKAVPKRILDSMNVKGLTRENVASHLQKFRLYLKRISNQQAHMGAAAGVQGSGFGDFRTLAGARLANVALSPYTNGGMLGRLNTPGNVNLGNLNPTPSTLIQPGQAQNLSNSINSLGRMHPVPLNSNQNPSLQSSLELDQLQQGEGAATFNSIINSRVFRNGGTVAGTGAALGNSNLPMLHGNGQPLLNGGGFGNQSAHGVASFNASLLDPGKCSENWHNPVEVSKMHPNALFSNEPFPSQLLPPNGSRENIPSNGPYVALPPFEDSRYMQCHQLGSWGDAHNMNQIPANGSLPNSDQNSGILNQMMNMNFDGSSSGGASAHMQQDEGGKMATETVSNGDEQPKSQDRFAPHGYDSMNKLVHAIAPINQGDGI